MSAQPKLMKRRGIRVGELREIVKRQFIAHWNDNLENGDGARFWTECHLQSATKARLLGWLGRMGTCDYSGEKINGQPFDFDHKIPNALLYEGDEIVWEVVLRKWHKIKSKTDVKDIARAKRRAGETGQYARRKRRDKPLIQGRGFQPAPAGHTAWGKPRAGNGGGFNRGYKDTARYDD